MAEIRTEEMLLNVGPQHPSTHGVLRVVIKLDGEIIKEATPVIGYLHRGTEKLSEDLQYPQIIPYFDRLDYVAAMLNNHAIVHAIEQAMDIEVPERAEYLRVIVAELNRVASHLLFVGAYLLDLGAMSPFLYVFMTRERIIEILNDISGARLTYNYMRVGGVKYDAPPGWFEKIREFIPYFKEMYQMFNDLITGNEIFLSRVVGVGKYNAEKALNYGLSGIPLRAAGFNWDLRKNKPYSVYERFDFEIPLGKNGDNFDRYYLHLLEMEQSMRIVEQAINTIPDGQVTAKVPKIIRVPAGEYYSAVEAAKGELGVYIVSDGKDKPYRMKIRRPSFDNLQIIPSLLKGQNIADFIAILGSIDIVLGEVDA